MTEYILEMKNIIKRFPGGKALDGVGFSVKAGEIHALVGENGAGKSTLMKILSGVYPFGSYEGQIFMNGLECRFSGIKESEKAGVAIIHQEMALVKELNICENILLGNEISHAGIIKWDEAHRSAGEALNKVGLNIGTARKVSHLGVGEQQQVEIAKALFKKSRVLILDEPTAALSEGETAKLMAILKELRAGGVTCVYISHRLKEVLELADRVTVLRDGKTVCTLDRDGLTESLLISRMVGRELSQIYPRKQREPGDVIFEVRNWEAHNASEKRSILDVGFSLRKGEILGIAGLVGAGRSELFMSIFGAWGKKVHGEVILHGRVVELNSPREAIASGIGLATEDRKRYGLVLTQDIRRNISLVSLGKISRAGVVDENEEIRRAEMYTADLNIKSRSLEQKVVTLSGGNQQKVVLAKWLMAGPTVLVLDEPTRGIDVGAKLEIYNIINDLVDHSVGIIIISSDLPELLGMSDRILVMHEGRITGNLLRDEATQESIMRCATGAAA